MLIQKSRVSITQGVRQRAKSMGHRVKKKNFDRINRTLECLKCLKLQKLKRRHYISRREAENAEDEENFGIQINTDSLDCEKGKSSAFTCEDRRPLSLLPLSVREL